MRCEARDSGRDRRASRRQWRREARAGRNVDEAERFVERVGFAACLTTPPARTVALRRRLRPSRAVMPRNVQKDPGGVAHLAVKDERDPARQGLLREARPRQGDVPRAADDSLLQSGLGHATGRGEAERLSRNAQAILKGCAGSGR